MLDVPFAVEGADAVVWELTVSHETLTIVVTQNGRAGNLALARLDPRMLRGPVRWSNSELGVSRVSPPIGDEDRFRVTDTKAASAARKLIQSAGGTDVEILCAAVEARETPIVRAGPKKGKPTQRGTRSSYLNLPCLKRS